MSRKIFGLVCAGFLVLAVACSSGPGTTSPKAKDGVLLKAGDLAGMRVANELPADAAVFSNVLAGGELFKDDPPVALKKLQGFGLKRGYIEGWSGAGLDAGAFMVEFDSDAHAAAAVAYMKTELFRPCPDEPQCSNRIPVSHPAIPNFVGQSLTPLRPANEGRQATIYKFLWRAGAAVFGVKYGGNDVYDPASVSQALALDVADALYGRIKGKSFDTLFRSTPRSPLGPPPPSGPPPSP